MNANTQTTEKILAEALELHEKGVSLHSIVRTYPEHKTEIEELFGSMATLSLEKEKVRIPAGALERLLAAMPEIESTAPRSMPITSPFAGIFAGLQASSLRYVLPIAALAILTGGIVLQKGPTEAPLAVAPVGDTTSSTLATMAMPDTQGTTSPATAPMAMKAAALATNPMDRMVASFQEEAAYEATIAGRDDADTEKAVAENAALTTDLTTSHAN